MNNEIWKKIPGFEHYEISNDGRVRKISLLSSCITKSLGYPQVQLFLGNGHGGKSMKDKKVVKKAFIHRLVAQAFIPNPLNHKIINHKDGDKKNFSIDNLEWCTASHNMKHAYDSGLNKGGKSQQNRTVVQFDEFGEIVKIWKGFREIVNNEYTWNKVYDSIKRKVWYRDCKWYYTDFYYDYRDEKFFIKNNGIKIFFSFSDIEKLINDNHHNVSMDILSNQPATRFKKSVIKMDILGNYIETYPSILEAHKKTKIDRSDISKCCTGIIKKAGNYLWRYATLEEYTSFINSLNK